MNKLTVLALSAALFAGCAGDVSEGKVEAAVKEVPAEAPAAKEAAPAGDAWSLDVAASSFSALGAKITGQHTIKFPKFEGAMQIADGGLVGAKVEIDMTALEADREKLTGHLKSGDFFNVEANPTSTFEATEVKAGAEGEGMTHTITGRLTMAGKTNEVTFPAKVELADGKASASAEFAIDRQQWEISYPGKPDDLIQDKVVLTISMVATKG